MKRIIIIVSTAFFSCASSKQAKTEPNVQKVYYKPVFLSVSGIEKDTSIKTKIIEQLRKSNIKLVDEEEFKTITMAEAKRAREQIFRKENDLSSVDKINKLQDLYHRYAGNLLNVNLVLHEKDDSFMIFKASFRNNGFPPNFGRPEMPKQREIDLSKFSYSVTESIRSIVDAILNSKDLK